MTTYVYDLDLPYSSRKENRKSFTLLLVYNLQKPLQHCLPHNTQKGLRFCTHHQWER